LDPELAQCRKADGQGRQRHHEEGKERHARRRLEDVEERERPAARPLRTECPAAERKADEERRQEAEHDEHDMLARRGPELGAVGGILAGEREVAKEPAAEDGSGPRHDCGQHDHPRDRLEVEPDQRIGRRDGECGQSDPEPAAEGDSREALVGQDGACGEAARDEEGRYRTEREGGAEDSARHDREGDHRKAEHAGGDPCRWIGDLPQAQPLAADDPVGPEGDERQEHHRGRGDEARHDRHAAARRRDGGS
jgi:hypothetical protein